MSYGFTRLVCINPPTKKEIQEWNPDLDEVAISILMQLLESEYIQDQVVPDYDSYHKDTSAVYTAWGIDSLLHSIARMHPKFHMLPPRRYGLDTISCIIDRANNLAIAFYHNKEVYSIELTPVTELMEKIEGAQPWKN